MAAWRPGDQFEPSRLPAQTLGSVRLSAGVVLYTVGICAAAVCAPLELSAAEVVAIVNREHPTGISVPWSLSDDERFRTGQPNPTSCDRDPGRVHRLLSC